MAGGICGFILGLTSRSMIGMIITTIVGAFVGTFDLPLVIFAGIVGFMIVVTVIVMKFMLGMY